MVRPSLGVNVAEDRVLRSIEMQLRKELKGVMVVEVLPESPAEKAGLQATVLRSDGTIELGDLITEINGQKIECVEDLLSAIEVRADEETVVVKVWRKCDRRMAENIRVKLTSRQKLNAKQGSVTSGKRSMSSIGGPRAWQ